MDETVDAAPYSRDATGLMVVGQKRRRIACGGGLARGEQAFPGGSLTGTIDSRLQVFLLRCQVTDLGARHSRIVQNTFASAADLVREFRMLLAVCAVGGSAWRQMRDQVVRMLGLRR
jgi:hypothetical protein